MINGGCLCGAVRFEVSEFESSIFKCHCSKCRKAFGGASSSAALTGEDGFSWLQGSDDIQEYQSDSGFKRRFCPDCGSILPQYLPDYKMHWIPVGLLDSDPGIRLEHHIYVDSKAEWEILDAETSQLGGGFGSA